MNEISLSRLYLLRAMYLLIIVGLGIEIWPGVIYNANSWELMEGVVACMLAAFSALSILGLCYPLQMLPLLLWELVWKILWLMKVALPLWYTGRMDPSTWAVTTACLMVVIVPIVIPWRYVFAHYVKKPTDRWR